MARPCSPQQVRKMCSGFDKDADAIVYARERYGAPGLTFELHNAFDFSPATTYGLVVCLETIEHVSDPARLIERLARLLAPGGTFVGSVPVTVSTDVNPFHLHDFTEPELVGLVRRTGLIPRERDHSGAAFLAFRGATTRP